MVPIPPLVDGHLPPGRFRCGLDELEGRFVDHPEFAHSATRRELFDGFLRYLLQWEVLEVRASAEGLLRCVWVAGSFASGCLDPQDVDVSPVVDGVIADETPRRGIKKLTKHRDSIKQKYGVEVFPIEWRPVPHILHSKGLVAQDAAYFQDRGRMDDFWQRRRTDETAKLAPTVEECVTRRGYLEVMTR